MLLIGLAFLLQAIGQEINSVIHISVDGLRPDAITALGPNNAPNFYRLRTQGAFTDNARTDYDWTVTLPNHTCQLTGRPVFGAAGHQWTYNGDPAPEQTLASNCGDYIAGVFDVAHDNGLHTAMFVSKTKFSLYPSSWGDTNGAPDLIPPDCSRNKIDLYRYDADPTALMNALTNDLITASRQYVFFHFANTDHAGHGFGWDVTPGSEYSSAVKHMDELLGVLFNCIDGGAQLSNHTAIILTADHGGAGFDHSNPLEQLHYTIPFYVWGAPVTPGVDLYKANTSSRQNPEASRLDYAVARQPIRNGDAANLALMLLGLPSVPASTINADQSLGVFAEDFRLVLAGPNEVFTFWTRPNLNYDIERSTNLLSGSWSVLVGNIPGTGGKVTHSVLRPLETSQEFFRLRPHP